MCCLCDNNYTVKNKKDLKASSNKLNMRIGWLFWLSFVVLMGYSVIELDVLSIILLFAVFIIIPLALNLISSPNRYGYYPHSYRILVRSYPFTSFLAGISFLYTPGLYMALFAAPWLIFTFIAAFNGLIRLLPRGIHHIEETCIEIGLLYLSIGGIWLFLSRSGVPVFGFSDDIVVLTAIHFHFISLTALINAGMVGRMLKKSNRQIWGLYQIAAIGTIISPAFVAVGIVYAPVIERIAALSMAFSLIIIALVTLRYLLPIIDISLAKILLGIASVSVMVAMLYAIGYAFGRITGAWVLTIPQMILVHGSLNAFGFLSLIAWKLIAPQSNVPLLGVPFSKLASKGKVGPLYFQNYGIVAKNDDPPEGLVDSMDDYKRLDFDPIELHPNVRAFYEKTAMFELLVMPDWKPGFRKLAGLYKKFSAWVGQMNLPLDPESEEDLIDSEILPIDDRYDGRSNVRGWVRTYNKTGEAVYVAAYANHSDGDHTYMNIAFPLPWGNLTSVLRIESLGNFIGGKGVCLTSLHSPDRVGDEGVYFANRIIPIRIPINEAIQVRPVEDSDIKVVAIHEMWFWRFKFLELEYRIRVKS